MSKFKFTPDLFYDLDYNNRHRASEHAQAALDKHLETLDIVKRSAATGTFSQSNNYGDETHTAVLFNLELIEKKKCTHPAYLAKKADELGYIHAFTCRDCGIKIKPATWKAVTE